MPKHVAVLMGGWSSERPVSLNSGRACAKALEEAGYRVTAIDVDRTIASVLDDLRPDVCFNALHGPYGEDGTVQGILEVLEIPYTHSGVLASALAMNKPKAKHVLKAAGIPVVEHRLVNRFDAVKAHVLPPPYVVKPPAEGSSFGVLIVPEDAAFPPQQLSSSDWPYGDLVMVEAYVPGRELTCGVMGGKALDVIEVVPAGEGFYDYDAKYRPGGSKHLLPAPLKHFVYQNVQKLAAEAHEALGCRGVSRADFRFNDRGDGTGELVCLEVNTQPGMTATSLVPEMAQHAGISFAELVSWMVEDASCRR
ncbi:D-alanine--D-alanine ligase [Chthonobacter albigriseus]|uniref:D-alanine--D-alanine ligase n=1 Tax=Chthonobacter albigriseus TaxID=1683161 RepID=UPI0015EF0311|nr:D-alanine--D-alanine ligase [Chthonobacter albigriseus]